MKIRYILPLIIIVIGCALFFHGRYEADLHNSPEPWTHFTGLCTDTFNNDVNNIEVGVNNGCPEQVKSQNNATVSSGVEYWKVEIIAGFGMFIAGITLGTVYFVSDRRHGKKLPAKHK